MKLKSKLTIAAIAAFLPVASAALADPVGETENYRIVRIQVGNGIPVIAYVAKEPTTVALNVHGAAAGSTSNNGNGNLRFEMKQNGHGQPQYQYVQGGIQ